MSSKTNKATYDPETTAAPSVFHFRVENQPTQQSVADIDRDIAEQEAGIAAQRKVKETLIAEQKQQDVQRLKDLNIRRGLLVKEAENWTKRSGMYKNREDIDDALNRAAECWDKIAAIDVQLPAPVEAPAPVVVEKPATKTFHTSWAVATLAIAAVALWFAFEGFGWYDMAVDSRNDSLRRMLNAAGFRMLLNGTFWACSLLVAVSYLYFFNRDLWFWFHNRVNSVVSFQQDFLQCAPSDRLKFFTQNFWAAAFLFALCLLCMMG